MSFSFLFSGINLQVEKIEDSIRFIRSRPKPLALYVFTKNKTLERRMISETSSGSLTFNDAILQVLTTLSTIISLENLFAWFH